MAARNNPRNRDSSYKLQSAMQLLNRLNLHANGEIELSATQIKAAQIVIGKYIPDLKAIEMTASIEVTKKPEDLTDEQLAAIASKSI